MPCWVSADSLPIKTSWLYIGLPQLDPSFPTTELAESFIPRDMTRPRASGYITSGENAVLSLYFVLTVAITTINRSTFAGFKRHFGLFTAGVACYGEHLAGFAIAT